MFRFMDAGGWSMLNVWVAEAKKMQNKSLLIELLQVSSPVDVSIVIEYRATVYRDLQVGWGN